MIRVMIVAAHIDVREGLSTVLRLADNIEIAEVASGLGDAVRQVRAGCPDAAVVDLEMPSGEGFETIRQLASLCPTTKVIALTAHDYPAAKDSAIKAGATAVMVKGLDFPEMVAVINATVACGAQQSRDER